jgi:hypothetical protein
MKIIGTLVCSLPYLEHLHPLAATGTPTGSWPVPNPVASRGARPTPHRRHLGSRRTANGKAKSGEETPKTLISALGDQLPREQQLPRAAETHTELRYILESSSLPGRNCLGNVAAAGSFLT